MASATINTAGTTKTISGGSSSSSISVIRTTDA